MKFCVVIVTYNRLDKLKKTLSCYEKEKNKIDTMVIVNNFSNDGTKEFLEDYCQKKPDYKIKLLNMTENLGGAGGFFEGMKCAMKENADWIYISDDDAYPKNNTLEEIEKVYLKIDNKDEIVALCSVVENKNGIDYGHRLKLRKNAFLVKWRSLDTNEYKKEYFDIDIFSYVGSAINVDKLFSVGLDRKEFFIYHDDQEHSIRLRKLGRILVCSRSVIHHDTEANKYQELFWGNYYDARNRLLMIKYNFPLRYYYTRYYVGYLRDCIFCANKEKKMLLKAAYSDAKNNKMGLHDVYKPGWNPQNEKSSKQIKLL